MDGGGGGTGEELLDRAGTDATVEGCSLDDTVTAVGSMRLGGAGGFDSSSCGCFSILSLFGYGDFTGDTKLIVVVVATDVAFDNGDDIALLNLIAVGDAVRGEYVFLNDDDGGEDRILLLLVFGDKYDAIILSASFNGRGDDEDVVGDGLGDDEVV